jgi:LemA protein
MILVSVALVLFALIAVSVSRTRRRLFVLDANCEAAAAAVDAELSHLHALLPPLVGLMRAFAPQEREATEAVARAHAAVQRAASPQARLLAETRLADGAHALIARAGRVAQLRNMHDFSALLEEMAETERRLAAARRKLSGATEAYNRALGHFPENLFALRLRLAPRAFYDIGEEMAAIKSPVL